MSHTESMKIKKGGKLVLEVWEKQQLHDVDVSANLQDYLLQKCEVEDGITLKDLLLLVKPHALLLSPMLTSSPDWLGEIIAEGLNQPFKPKIDGIDYLELSWCGELRKYDKEPKQFDEWTNFNGMGPVPKDDQNYKNWPTGQPVNYALDFAPIYTISELPLKVNSVMKAIDETNRKIGGVGPVLFEAEKEFTLAEILRGVFWELSFHGSPKSRDERSEELKMRIEKIDSGETELIPWEDVKKRIQEKFKKDE